jgi:hypothetical protein
MKKFIFLIFGIHCFSLLLYAQNIKPVTRMSSAFMPQGYVSGSLNSAGFSRMINHHAGNIGNINPACISQFENLSFGLSYQFETDVSPAWIGHIGHSRSHLANFGQTGKF